MEVFIGLLLLLIFLGTLDLDSLFVRSKPQERPAELSQGNNQL